MNLKEFSNAVAAAVVLMFMAAPSQGAITSTAFAFSGAGYAWHTGNTTASPGEYVTYSQISAQATRYYAVCYNSSGPVLTSTLPVINNGTSERILMLGNWYHSYCGWINSPHCVDTQAKALHISSGNWISLDLDTDSFPEPFSA